jgi:hypothetical protein
MIMPSEQDRREYPDLTDAEWAGVEQMRAYRRKMEGEHVRNPAPSFEELVLEQLREQTFLLGRICDLLAEGNVSKHL